MNLLYIEIVLIFMLFVIYSYSLLAVDLSKVFKKGHVLEIRIIFFSIALILAYLSANALVRIMYLFLELS